MKKFKINKKKVERNIIILLWIIGVAVIIYIVKLKGISFFSTIGYFD